MHNGGCICVRPLLIITFSNSIVHYSLWYYNTKTIKAKGIFHYVFDVKNWKLLTGNASKLCSSSSYEYCPSFFVHISCMHVKKCDYRFFIDFLLSDDATNIMVAVFFPGTCYSTHPTASKICMLVSILSRLIVNTFVQKYLFENAQHNWGVNHPLTAFQAPSSFDLFTICIILQLCTSTIK